MDVYHVKPSQYPFDTHAWSVCLDGTL